MTLLRLASLLPLLFVAAAQAAPMHCDPLSAPASFVPREAGADVRDFDTYSFEVKQADGSSTEVSVAGRYCQQTYAPKEGGAPLSAEAVHANYRAQLAQIGAQTTAEDVSNFYAKLLRNGAETWIRVYGSEAGIEVTVVEKASHKQVLTAPTGQDYRLLGHMPTFEVHGDIRREEAGNAVFALRDAEGQHDVNVQGKVYEVHYAPREGAPIVSAVDILSNYRNAMEALGAEIVASDAGNVYARLLDQGRVPLWLRVYASQSGIEVTAVEEKPFAATIQPPPPTDALKSALDTSGHVALYINFDFAKATLKPDAKAVVDQVLALLNANSSLKLAIEGHTDNIGGGAANQKLSELRAQAVVDALVQRGIAADRLSASGYGASKPVADNGSSEGRAKNRRVELAKR